MVLPGESISKYRNLGQPAAEPQPEIAHPSDDTAVAAEHLHDEHAETAAAYTEEIAEEAIHLDQGYEVAPEQNQNSATDVESHSSEAATPEPEVTPTAAVTEEDERPRSKRRWGWRRKAAEAEAAASSAVAAQTQPGAPELASSETQEPHAPEAHIFEGGEHTSAHHSTPLDQPSATAQEIAEPTQANEPDIPQHAAGESPLFERDYLEANPPSEQPPADPQAEPSAHPNSDHHRETVSEVATSEVVTEGREAHDFGAGNEAPEHHAAPSIAPEGRTLEHEVLEDEEAEFQPMPHDLNAMREVAGDEELVLEEETLDAGNGYNERWVPKIEEVDEDEVIAAEERGEKIYEAEEEDEENEDEPEEEANDRAEVRAAAPTAGYQQRTAERPAYDRDRRGGYRDRNRRGGPGGRRNFRSRPNAYRNQPLITDLLKEGQEVLIQIAKEPIGKKGARITSHIALPGRFLVYMPTVNHVGVSRKIASDEERQRLKRIVTSERENGLGGFIVRTAAANIKEEDLRADIRFLKHLWHEIKDRAENSKSPALIYHDLNLVERVLRDQVNADFSQIWVDTEDEYERVVRFANRFQPSLVRRIKLYTKDAPLFEQFGIQDEINRSLKSKVWLKSGGHIVINQTEALVAIDVNTGKFVGKTQRLEDTIVKTNVDAIKEIVRQIRLRDLGGIIVIDFIDMDERKNRQKVMVALEEALRNDRAPSKVLQFNDFGLVAITRKRVKQSLERTLAEPCPYCTGAGFVKSVPTVCNELYIEMRKMAKVHDKNDITVRVNPEVAKALKASNGKLITELEDLTGKTVLVKSDPALHQEMFDIH